MNVMELVSGAGINGAVMHCLLLSRELVRRGHGVTVVCRPGAWIGEQLAGGEVAVVESELSRWPPRELRRVARIARERRIDVLHSHMSRAHFFGVLLRGWSGVPCVATAHSRHVQVHWMFNDRVIAVSEATRRYHRARNFVRRRRIEVIHNFVDHQRFTAVGAGARRSTRSGLGIDLATPLLGAIGTVVPQKGLVYLLDALSRVRAAMPGVRLLVVGDGAAGDAAAVQDAARGRGMDDAILYLERRTDVPELLAALDVFVSASLDENLPQSVLEAMAAGIPVVATAVGGVPECVDAQRTGLLVPPADDAALAAAVISLLRDADARQRLGAAGQRRVQRHFAPETQVPRIEAVLSSAAAARERSSQLKPQMNTDEHR